MHIIYDLYLMTWTCPKCEREFPKPEQRHYCARVSLDSLFTGKPPELLLIFDKILAEVADWDGVLVGTTPNCIVFTHRLTFLVIRPMKKWLEVKYYAKDGQGKKGEQRVRLTLLDELQPKVFQYIRESYLML
jgi:hypothetical protein